MTVPTFGILTPPSHTTVAELIDVWQAADDIATIEHAWLFDHLMPIGGNPNGPTLEGWTTLAALAARTTRLDLGLLVTSNRLRPPALLAKIAATVDNIANGRIVLGIGVGSRPNPPSAHHEYDAHGIAFAPTNDAIESFTEACEIIDRLWTDDEPFDYHGRHHHLTRAWCNPKPARRPRPPILIGGRATPTLRTAARHADIWNMPGGTIRDATKRSRLLDQLCNEIDRDPTDITRSIVIPAHTDNHDTTTQHIDEALTAGFEHIVLTLNPPYTAATVQQCADDIIHDYAATS